MSLHFTREEFAKRQERALAEMTHWRDANVPSPLPSPE